MSNFIIIFFECFPAMLSGFLLTLSFPKNELTFLAWIALVPLILYLYRVKDSATVDKKKAFNAGFIMGLCHFLSLLYWIVPTISTYGLLPLFVAVPILMLLACYLALYPAVFTFGLSWFQCAYMQKNKEKKNINPSPVGRAGEGLGVTSLNNLLMPLVAAALWVSLEYIRSIFLTGFPWGLVGYSQYMHLNLIQIADITSVYGISFMVVMTNFVLAKVVMAAFAKSFKIDVLVWIICLVVMFGGVIGYGKIRITDIEKEAEQSEMVNISVVQGNIDQVLKWDLAYQESTITKYCKLSIEAAQQKIRPDLIILPETALPFYYGWNKQLSSKFDECIREAGTSFLIGSPAFKTVDEVAKIYNFYNRAYMVNELGVIIGSCDKVHLVPFGEYVPFGKYLSFLGKIIAQAGDFSSGETDIKPLTFTGAINKSSAGVLICFEIIFPYLSRTAVKNGAHILVTMTNDAWFGYTSAAKQHFTMAVFRAIENRRAVARAANTGISGFIDQTGKIVQTSELFKDAALTQQLPSMNIKTTYTKFGDIFAFVCMFAIAALFVVNIARKKAGSKTKS
ncbi:MAG: apolipoprotein N-acyltransferase [Desulfamplus sp.]|nr:apolipoprotein N-acyltransferase [Desulfamplus sp.]